MEFRIQQNVLKEWEEDIRTGQQNLLSIPKVVGENAAYLAKMNAPVGIGFQHAGKMRDSIKVAYDTKSFTLSCDAEDRYGSKYAYYNEFGSYNTPIGTFEDPVISRSGGHRPFMRPAIVKAIQKYAMFFGQKWYNKIIEPEDLK